MKRKIFSVLAIAAIAFVSCKKEEGATPAEPGTCTIQGTVEAALDLSNDTTASGAFSFNLNPEPVTTGRMHFVINSMDLDHNPDPSYDYQDLTYHADISNGAYSIDVPAISTPLMVDVYFDDFNYAQRQYIASNPDSVVTQSYKFFMNPTTIGGVTDGAVIVQNFMYQF